jgi:hypothetical protein
MSPILIVMLILVFLSIVTAYVMLSKSAVHEPFLDSDTANVYKNVGSVLARITSDGTFINNRLDVVDGGKSLHDEPLCTALINKDTLPVTASNSCAHGLLGTGEIKNLRTDDPFYTFTKNKTYCYINTLSNSDSVLAPKMQCSKSNAAFNNPMFDSVYLDYVSDKDDILNKRRCILGINTNNVTACNMQLFSENLRSSSSNICKVNPSISTGNQMVDKTIETGRIMQVIEDGVDQEYPSMYKTYNSTPKDCVFLCMENSNCMSMMFDDPTNACRLYDTPYNDDQKTTLDNDPYIDRSYVYGRVWKRRPYCPAIDVKLSMTLCKILNGVPATATASPKDPSFTCCKEFEYTSVPGAKWMNKDSRKAIDGIMTDWKVGTRIANLEHFYNMQVVCDKASAKQVDTHLFGVTAVELAPGYTMVFYLENQCANEEWTGPYMSIICLKADGKINDCSTTQDVQKNSPLPAKRITLVDMFNRKSTDSDYVYDIKLSNEEVYRSSIQGPSIVSDSNFKRYVFDAADNVDDALIYKAGEEYAISARAVQVIHPARTCRSIKTDTKLALTCGFTRILKQTYNIESKTTNAFQPISGSSPILSITLGPQTAVALYSESESWIKFYNMSSNVLIVDLPHKLDFKSSDMKQLSYSQFMKFIHSRFDAANRSQAKDSLIVTFDGKISGGIGWYGKTPLVKCTKYISSEIKEDPRKAALGIIPPRNMFAYSSLFPDSKGTSSQDKSCPLSKIRFDMQSDSTDAATLDACVSMCSQDTNCMGVSFDVDNKCRKYSQNKATTLCTNKYYRYDAGGMLMKKPLYLYIKFINGYGLEYLSCGTENGWKYLKNTKQVKTDEYERNYILVVNENSSKLPSPEKNVYLSLRKTVRLVLGPLTCMVLKSPDGNRFVELHNITEENVDINDTTDSFNRQIVIQTNIEMRSYDKILSEVLYQVHPDNPNAYSISVVHSNVNLRKVSNRIHPSYKAMQYGWQDLSSVYKTDYANVPSLDDCITYCENVDECKSLLYTASNNTCSIVYDCLPKSEHTLLNDSIAFMTKNNVCAAPAPAKN